MNALFVNLTINSNLYLKDPQKTELGRKIIEHSVHLIDELGLDQFTFRKLAERISSAEASIYRYFENKHQLFVYLLNWYWEWMIVRIDFNTINIDDPIKRLQIVLSVVADTARKNTAVAFVDEEALHRIVVQEGTKAYHHKLVDSENKDGYFLAYKRLCGKIAAIIQEINPDFPYPRALANTLIETANNNLYFAQHLPRLTDLRREENELTRQVRDMLAFFCSSLIDCPSLNEKKNLLERPNRNGSTPRASQ